MTSHALTLDHVTVDVQRRCVAGRRLGTLRVLEQCSLHVPAGTTLALMGPTACGKSTLLDLFAGFVRPVAGRVEVGRRPVQGPAPESGFVQPVYGLFPWRTARQNVEFAAGAAAGRSIEVLEFLGLGEVADRPLGALTPAQKRRVAIAKAVVQNPGVLLLDDPFATLDTVDRALLIDDLVRLQRETGVTVVFATSSLDDAVRVGNRVAVLSPRPGRITDVIEVDPAHHLAAAHTVWSALNEPVQLARAA